LDFHVFISAFLGLYFNLRKPYRVKTQGGPVKCPNAQSSTLTLGTTPPHLRVMGKALPTFAWEDIRWTSLAGLQPVYRGIKEDTLRCQSGK
jgi:hypothetical protein